MNLVPIAGLPALANGFSADAMNGVVATVLLLLAALFVVDAVRAIRRGLIAEAA